MIVLQVEARGEQGWCCYSHRPLELCRTQPQQACMCYICNTLLDSVPTKCPAIGCVCFVLPQRWLGIRPTSRDNFLAYTIHQVGLVRAPAPVSRVVLCIGKHKPSCSKCLMRLSRKPCCWQCRYELLVRRPGPAPFQRLFLYSWGPVHLQRLFGPDCA